MAKLLTIFIFSLMLSACAGKVDYVPPSSYQSKNSQSVNKPIDSLWKSAVAQLSGKFFVINTIDRSSGLINVSYSGDPERYIDCGYITSYVKNARGERTHSFSGASARKHYEIMNDNGLFNIDREMSLEGRANIVVQETSATTSLVTVNTRYIVTRKITSINAAGGIPGSDSRSINFNTGGSASFPSSAASALTCTANGVLEREILSAIAE